MFSGITCDMMIDADTVRGGAGDVSRVKAWAEKLQVILARLLLSLPKTT